MTNINLTCSVRESLSEYAHEAWSGWMVYALSKMTLNEDGTATMPKWAVERWMRQANTKFSDLPESEKESDRDEADRMLSILNKSQNRVEQNAAINIKTEVPSGYR